MFDALWYILLHKNFDYTIYTYWDSNLARNFWAITGNCQLAAPINFIREGNWAPLHFILFLKWQMGICNQWLPLVFM